MTDIKSILNPPKPGKKPVTLVSTHHDYPPVPARNFDWSAVVTEYYDEGEPVGHGPTEDAAVKDLLDHYLDDFPKMEGALVNVFEAYLIRALHDACEKRKSWHYTDKELHCFRAGFTDCMSELFSLLEG